jgi:ribosomal protein S18 acetylase RimI-like enzyme
MSFTAGESAVRDYSHVFVDKGGKSVVIKMLAEGMAPALIEMYLAYQPKDSFDGLPPIKEAACVEWVQGMIRTGVNMVALSSEGSIVGHAAIFPIDERRCEILMAVSPQYQNIGIGTELTRSSTHVAQELGFQQAWLCVETRNARARHIFKKCGFERRSGEEHGDVEMVLNLKR